ncbi:2,3-bisphosphoglycerate-independent phosphoglycerate mutase [Candidatus Xianfuyuplasma coldseepsis]|uniref:2,3-bisphosphoglycerate-independent phosphoglycerate mutase n=1 Tax=Candidatus Xianfuyuplasma coldseepsis TaxID=2782163 RepID=A0A7L7KQP9_9MOLU|nr:2,3-bisphosphoglycerate-independent phosphoglycerate mutase [Xianfuyuplasma coldseepsis]QMS84274.1 2,3-bisphosphoglycerate-independent phosphoglycerate mutase [Xianfuyuplasma coldseepsis]
MKRPVALIVMDGYGLRNDDTGNAVHMAKTPNIELLMNEYPTSYLNASGLAVGLPDGQMGNSEVGHLNLGAGRIVYQSLTRINKAIEDGEFFTNQAYLNAIKNVKENNSVLHIMGLLSDGGVHSHINHIKAFFKLAKDQGVPTTYFHAFLDGRDTPPDSGVLYVQELEAYMAEINYGKIASVGGRYYGMDRDKNWDRVQIHYDVFTQAKGPSASSAIDGIKASYKAGVFDEFVMPFNVVPEGTMKDGDSVIFANFRPDRAIQIGTALSNPTKSGLDYSKGPHNLTFVSTMSYSENVQGEIAFGLQKLDNMYGDVISRAGKKQLRIAETEKYAHVTFFFDGGMDKEIEGSTRVLVNSPKVATYDLQPEMSAYIVTDKVLDEIAKDEHDTIILNFANCDMVGHTGVIPAAVKAVETVDECVGKVVDAILDKGGVAIVTADHGNAEKMLDENGNPFTAHTTSIVPLIVTDKNVKLREGGILADVAPTMLQYLGIDQPSEMTGQSLVTKK